MVLATQRPTTSPPRTCSAYPLSCRPPPVARVEAALAFVISFASFRRLTAGGSTPSRQLGGPCKRVSGRAAPVPIKITHHRPALPLACMCGRRLCSQVLRALDGEVPASRVHTTKRDERNPVQSTHGRTAFHTCISTGIGGSRGSRIARRGERPVPSEGPGGGLIRATPAGVCRKRADEDEHDGVCGKCASTAVWVLAGGSRQGPRGLDTPTPTTHVAQP